VLGNAQVTDQFGRFTGQQMFGVWDIERKVMVLPLDWRKDAKQRAENFIAQLELPL
jgi:hypothetical protein